LAQCLFLCHIYILEQRKIVAKIESLFSIANRIEQAAKEAKMKIERTYMSILARAYRGKLLKQDPNDEPASVVLERIKLQDPEEGSKSLPDSQKQLTLN